MIDLDLTMVRGDTAIFTCTLLNESSEAFDLTDCTITFTAKESISDLDVDAIIQLTSPSSGITFVGLNPLLGQFDITVSPTDTSSLSGPVTLVCDIQLEDSLGRIFTLGKGTIEIVEDVTRS